MAYWANNTFSKLLGSTKDNGDHLEKSSSYKIKRSDCDEVYVGKTTCKTQTKFKQHVEHFMYENVVWLNIYLV